MPAQRTGVPNFNFFQWIREGVRQSVLLGVSDAVETLGTPEDEDAIHPRLLAALAENGTDETRKSVGGSNAAKRKRLGRSLKDLNPETQS